MSGERRTACSSWMSEPLLAEIALSTTTLPRVVCAWCGKTMKNGLLPASHTICSDCDDRVRNERCD
jgi:hypothetical protein